MTTLIDLTDFGDLAVLLPLALTIAVWLFYRSPRVAAPWWLVALVLCGGVTAVLKIVLFTCALVPELRSPSGHTSLSTLVYGALALIMGTRASRGQRIALGAAAALFVLAIAVSRVALHAHTLAEIIVGLAIGGAALVLFAWRYVSLSLAPAPLWPLLAPVCLLIAVLHGDQLRAEEFLRMIGAYLRGNALLCG